MSRRRKTKKKGMHPAVAVLVLVGCLGFSVKSISSSVGQTAAGDIVGLMGLDAGDVIEIEDEQQLEDIQWYDLLAEFGSIERSQPVRLAFAVVTSEQPVGAAPFGETAPAIRGNWTGDTPPFLRLGVVMVSAKSRRAVLGGTVVGVGGAIAGSAVQAIEPGVLRLQWRRRELTYDLDSEVPREFRAENARRLLEQQAAGEVSTGNLAADAEQGMEEK